MSEGPHHTPGEIVHDAAEAAAEVVHDVAVAAGRSWRQIALIVAAIALLVFGGLLAAMRYGVLLPQARLLIQAATNGLQVGRFGRLSIEGLSGDIWSDLSIDRLTLRDERGVWLEADKVHLKWRYLELLRRNFQADDIAVQTLKLVRRPSLAAGGEAGGLPLSFHIDHGAGRLELEPGFSDARGLFDLDFNLHVERSGGLKGHVRAASVLRPGDHLNADYDIARDRPLRLDVDAVEARGGALAGAVGLPSNQPFSLQVDAGGRTAQGRFTALALSGALKPLEAQGSWSRDQGQARGYASLTASRLTAAWAQRFGPEARFEISGRKAGPSLFALQARVQAENLTLAASGLGNLGTRTLGPQGIGVTATTPALSRITGGPAMGPTRVAGLVRPTKAGWAFSGQATVGRASLGAYSLERASGPLVLTQAKGEYGLDLRLAGGGGHGAGFVAAALGPAPRASFQGARLADGRLALRQLEVSGSGLKLSASGGRGLLGGLTFKGQASLGALAAARSGASGSAAASWSASQGRAGQPWALAFDAHGEKFATGYPEIDRLLGPRPQLRAKADVQGRRVAVGSAALQGAALQAAAAGVLDPDGKLAFKLDWTASGPFHAGPVEIAGKARGSGAITGTLGQPKADLLAHVDQIDAPRLPLKDANLTLTFERRPDGTAGVIAATAASGFGPARGRAAFRFPEGGLDLTELSVDAGGLKASGALSLRRNSPSAANLDLAITRGAFLDAGRIAGHVQLADAQGTRAVLDLSAENARWPGSEIVVHAGKLTADGPVSRLPYALTADGGSPQGKWTASGRGLLAEARPGWSASFDGSGKLGGRTLRTVETAALRFGGPERSARLRLAASDGGRIDLDGHMTDQGVDLRAQVAGLGLQMLDEDLTGKFDATLALQGRGPRLDGTLDAKLAGARGRGAPAASGVDGAVRGRLAGDVLTLALNASNAQGLQANGEVTLPAASSAAPFRVAIARQQPMRGRFSAQGEVRPLWDLLVGGERSLSGNVRTQGTLAGSLAEPRAAGEVAVQNGRFDDGGTGLSLRQVSLTAAFQNTSVDVTQASAVDGHGGAVNGAGRISLERQGVSSFRLNLKGFRLIDNEQATASATGQATIDRAANGKVRLSGALTIDQANVAARLPTPSGVVAMDVIEKNRPPEMAAALPPPSTGGEGWALDVTLKAPQRVLLRGRGLNVELSLDAHVGGTTTHPQLSGTARVVRGDYDFAGKRFEFDPQSVVYLSTRARDIRLDLLATRDDPTLTAGVHIRGTADKPEITLTSTPSLPNDEVLSQVLFGHTASQLSPLEAAQLASALSALAGGGGLDVIGNLRTFAGLDRLALGGGTSGEGVTVAGGKYLTNDVYLELAGGGREGPSAQVEWRLKRSLSVVSKVGTQAGSSLAIRWRKDY
ncbi:translocation/assembly module TamB domain-containing protein [Phenylobacterium sp.]|uniref:translocation/assembly module TamB domain-containing protein n=1 Tax=Phenylobacterium sp. TaxID=1871053 RepID=UPI002DEE7EC4|nr:translocation/assembly module TamB domain-containing protein [Phenylobacterium sp.]